MDRLEWFKPRIRLQELNVKQISIGSGWFLLLAPFLAALLTLELGLHPFCSGRFGLLAFSLLFILGGGGSLTLFSKLPEKIKTESWSRLRGLSDKVELEEQ